MAEKKSFERVLLINTEPDQEDPRKKNLKLVGVKGDKMFWDCGQRWMGWEPDLYEVVKEYSYFDDGDLHKFWREVDLLRCPDPQPPAARLGWINAEGHYFPCGYTAHDDLARLLRIKYHPDYSSYLGGKYALEELGWAAIMGGFVYRRVDGSWPEPMIKTLGDVLVEFVKAQEEGVDFNKSLLANPEHYELQGWCTPPNDDGDLVEKIKETYEREMKETQEQVNTPDSVSLLPPLGKLPKRSGEHPGD